MEQLNNLKAILHSKRANIYYLEYCRVMRLNKKMMLSFFNYIFLIILTIVNIIAIKGLIEYENNDDLGSVFALLFTVLVILTFVFILFIINLFIWKYILNKYHKLEIFNDFILINNEQKYLISELEYVKVFSWHATEQWHLKDKKSHKTIAHFLYRQYNIYFLKYSPKLIKTLIQAKQLNNVSNLSQEIEKDIIECEKSTKLGNKTKVITIIVFSISILLLVITICIGLYNKYY
ncbi:MAG: hypothetical protein L3I99_02995 [Sulfurimonas sp.]|nr:hypothetical protein [Sulfurimonas sp.]